MEELPEFWNLPLGYLSFLRFREGEITTDAVRVLRAEMSKLTSSEADQLIREYLKPQQGWRANLVGCVIMLMGFGTGDPGPLWHLLETWCWASPQVAATVSIVDPNFEAQAHKVLGGQIPSKAALALMALLPDDAPWRDTYGDGTEEMLGFVPKLTRTWKDKATLHLS